MIFEDDLFASIQFAYFGNVPTTNEVHLNFFLFYYVIQKFQLIFLSRIFAHSLIHFFVQICLSEINHTKAIKFISLIQDIFKNRFF